MLNRILRKLMFIPILMTLNISVAHTALSSGDIIIIGATGDDTDQMTWVPLVDLPAGEIIKFTDSGWHSGTNTWTQTVNGEG